MGWLWFSSTEEAKGEARDDTSQKGDGSATNPGKTARNFALTEEQQLRIFGKTSPAQQQSSSTRRDELADAELEAFLKSFESPEAQQRAPATNGTDSTTADTPAQSSAPTPLYDRRLPDGTLDISPDALLPRTMSCRQAFDQAFYCQSLGGKFNDIYRYGQVRSCSEHWGAFWFCMRTRALGKEEKERHIVDWHKQREEQKRQGRGSSEDVWPLRQVMVEKAFHKDPDNDEDSHEIALREG